MNDNTKVLDQSPVPPPVSNSTVQPQGSLNKEAPIGQNLSEFVRSAGSEVTPDLPREVSESGVKVTDDKPFLTPAHIESGVNHSGPNVIVPKGPTGLVQIPQTKDIGSSSTWRNAVIEKVRKLGKLLGV